MPKPRRESLPPTLPPRGLSRGEAAAYLGISTNLFSRLVDERALPPPKHLGGRSVWDRVEIDRAFGEMPSGDEPAAKADSWADYA